jgi:hypothetical protein
MSEPRVRFVEVVTREHGEVFADEWLERSWDTGAITEACAETEIIDWYDPNGGDNVLCVSLQNQIARRVADQLRTTVVETFVRLANAAIERERTRIEASLIPPRVKTVETVTPEHGLIFAEQLHREIADCEIFFVALSATHTMTFPDDGPDGKESAAQAHFHELTYEIRDRLRDETKQPIADAFVRVVNDVFSRERRRQ